MRALEARLRRAEAIVRAIAPELDLNDPSLDATESARIIASLGRERPQEGLLLQTSSTSRTDEEQSAENTHEPFLETMMENFGFLDLDDGGHWDYHGHSSWIFFMQRLQNQFGNLVVPPPSSDSRSSCHVQKSPKIGIGIQQKSTSHDVVSPPTRDLPSREAAQRLCEACFDHACVLIRFVHEPSFWTSFERIYSTPWGQYYDEDRVFLPQLYIVLAVGCLYLDDTEGIVEMGECQNLIVQGYVDFIRSSVSSPTPDC